MAAIALTLVDAPDGKVDIQIYMDGVVRGEEPGPALQLSSVMLKAAALHTEAKPDA